MISPDPINHPRSVKSATFSGKTVRIPTWSGCRLEKLCLYLGNRRGKWICVLSACLAFAACLWLGCPALLYAADKLNILDYETALQKGKDAPRPMVLFFTTPWCYQCTEMKRKVFQDKAVISILNERFFLVEVDISKNEKLKEGFWINYTPTSLFLDLHGNPITDLKGYISINRFRKLLQYVSEGHYKTTTFSDFEKK